MVCIINADLLILHVTLQLFTKVLKYETNLTVQLIA